MRSPSFNSVGTGARTAMKHRLPVAAVRGRGLDAERMRMESEGSRPGGATTHTRTRHYGEAEEDRRENILLSMNTSRACQTNRASELHRREKVNYRYRRL